MKLSNIDETRTTVIDDTLSKRILQRLGRVEGVVKVSAETWDFGYCETCSYLEHGFAVYVDDELVWPNDDYLNAFGGYVYADEHGWVDSSKPKPVLNAWGVFFEWLDGKDYDYLEREWDRSYYRTEEEYRRDLGLDEDDEDDADEEIDFDKYDDGGTGTLWERFARIQEQVKQEGEKSKDES